VDIQNTALLWKTRLLCIFQTGR